MPSHLLSLLLFSGALATLVLAHGPHYMPNHLAVERSVRERAASLAMEKREQHKSSRRGSRRSRKHRTCPSSSSGSSSSSSSKKPSSSSPSSSSSSVSSSSANTASSSTDMASLSAVGIEQFLGENGPAIASWFRTDSGSDSTNGHSWCGYAYNDDSNGFAPDVSLMLSNFGDDYNKAAEHFCGLEAIVTTPSGKSKTMYIIDGFDHTWVRTPGSIDITKNQFAELYGSATDDKNVVIQGITWKLTGKRSDQYKFKGSGN